MEKYVKSEVNDKLGNNELKRNIPLERDKKTR